MAITVNDLIEQLERLVEKKRQQASMSDHPEADAYRRGAASAMNVVSDEIMDIILEAKHNS